jgi:hypothetical protein
MKQNMKINAGKDISGHQGICDYDIMHPPPPPAESHGLGSDRGADENGSGLLVMKSTISAPDFVIGCAF